MYIFSKLLQFLDNTAKVLAITFSDSQNTAILHIQKELKKMSNFYFLLQFWLTPQFCDINTLDFYLLFFYILFDKVII